MERILPFKAVRYNKNVVGDLSAVVAPPYDAISESQQKELYEDHPFNVVRLECGTKGDEDYEAESRYARSADILNEWMYSGVLVPDKQPAVYVYGQEFELDGKQYSYKGLVCLVRLDEFEKGTVLPHEETLSKAKTDRFNLMMACGANFSAVSSLYIDQDKKVSDIVAENTQQPPESSVKTDDGVVHRIWSITDSETIEKLQVYFKDKQLFIADGHHRYEAAINYRDTLREINPDYTGEELYNYVMMFLADMDDIEGLVFPTHRLVKNVVGYSEQGFLSQIEEAFTVEKIFAENVVETVKKKLDANTEMPSFAMYTGKDYFYLLKLKDYGFADKVGEGKSKTLRHLGVTVLHTLVLGKGFGLTDSDLKNHTYLTYSHDFAEATREVKNGNFQCSIMLNPVKIHEIKDISLANEKMPQKSTYFYPKLITGLIMNKFN